MREGLYDSLLTARVARALEALGGTTAHTHALAESDAPDRLARFLADEVRRLLGDLHGEEPVAKQAALVNELLTWLQSRTETEVPDSIASPVL